MKKKISCFLWFFIILFTPTLVAGNNDTLLAVVQVEKAVNIDITSFIWVTGTVISRYDSKIAAEAEGRLDSILDAGDRVKEGDVIARINNKSYLLAVNKIRSETEPIEVMIEFYQRESERLKTLTQQNNVAKNQLEKMEANRDEALARMGVVKSRLAIAQDDLERTVIKAPFAGVISERIKSLGERVDVGEQVVRLVSTDLLEIQAYLQQESFNFIKQGDTLMLKSSQGDTEGTIRTFIPVGDDVSRLYEIRVVFSHMNWPIGMAVKVATPVQFTQNVIAVPLDALVIRQSGISIYKINENNVVEPVLVKTGVSNTTHIQVVGDIKENDSIVVRGNERLRPGQTVQIINGSKN